MRRSIRLLLLSLLALVLGSSSTSVATPTVTTSTCGKPVCTWNAFGPKTYVRPPEEERREKHEDDDDRPAVFTDSFSVLNTATQYTLHIVATEGPRAVIRLNGKQVVDEDDFRERPGNRRDKDETVTIDRPIALNLSNTLIVELLGNPGSRIEVSIVGLDNDPPTITALASPAPNSFAWNNTNVLVTFTCSDQTSGVAFCPAPVAVTTESTNQPVSGTAVDRAGNTATISLSVNIDKTPPVITATVTPPPNAFGFVIVPATITFTCTDALSGVLSCPSPIKVTNVGLNQTFSGTATDKAGNSSTTSVTLSVQSATPLTIVASASPPANIHGWNNSNVTISYTCSGGVPPVSCPGTQTVSTEGANQSVSANATDAVGQSVSASTLLNIDRTNPTITATVTPAPNANGVVTAPATITFTCTDALSGVATCPAAITVAALGTNQSFSGTTTDVAGNSSAPATVTLSVESSPLAITSSLSSSPNAAGWFSQPVTLTYQCSGGVPPVTCPSARTVATQGSGQSITGTATDVTGQTAVTVDRLSIDQIPPVVTAQATPAPNSNGWNNSDVTVTFQCSDDDSGVAVCPPTQIISSEGADQLISGTATDVAGNTASANLVLSIDKTPPSLSVLSPLDGSNLTTAQVAIQGLVTDNGSGIGSLTCNGTAGTVTGAQFNCTTSLTVGSNAVAVVATDVAGNTSTSTLNLIYSLPINVQITSPASLQLFSANPITVTGTVDHPNAVVTVGGVTATVSNGMFTASGVVLRESKNLLTATATSPDGGIGSDSVTVFLDTTPPVVHIDSPVAGAIVTTSQIDVTGNVNDLATGTVNGDQVSVLVNGVIASVANRSFAAHGVLLVPGQNTVTAVATDRAGNTSQHQVQVTLQQSIGQQTLTVVSGNNQSGPIGAVLAQRLVVQATDAIGRPIPNRTLTFAVVKSDGLIISGTQRVRTLTVQTDINGNATVQFQVGSRNGAGINQVAVTAPGFVGQALFSADSTVGAPTQIHPVSGEMQVGLTGTPLAEPLVAIVFDAGANPVVNVPVTFTVKSGGGLIGNSTTFVQNTDSDGKASALLILGPLPGINKNVVLASFTGQNGSPASFVASAVVPGPVADTTVSGVVLDDANEPIQNATARIKGTQLFALSNAMGRFTIPTAPVGNIVLFIDGSTSTDADTYPTLSFQMATLPGVENSLPGPIYLPALDTNNSQVVGGDQDVVLTMNGVPGLEYKVFAHSVTFPDGSHVGRLTLSQVHADKVPMTPPNGTAPRLVGTLQPAGVKFDPPIQMTLPNTDGLLPGQVVELFSFHHDIEQFVTEGTARVSEDGSVIVSDPGFGLTVSGWHGGGGNPPPPDCVVNVFVNIDSAPDEMDVEDQDSASATGNPTDTPAGCPASAPGFSWSSTSSSVLDVSGTDNTATLMAVAEGEADITVEYQDAGVAATAQKHVTVSTLKLDCSSTALTRGDSTTCTVTHFPQGATFQWEFDGDDGGTVKKTWNSNQWKGVIVESGTVKVTVLKADGTAVRKNPDPVTLTVSARTGGQWQMTNPSATEVDNGKVKRKDGTPVFLPVPPQPGPNCSTNANEAGTGCSGLHLGFAKFTTKPVDTGPNTGYQYFDKPLSMTVADGFFYNYEINPDLKDTQSKFYLAQCGDYPQNPGGFISGADLDTQTRRHEYNSAAQSHYAFFISAIPPHDLQVFFEQQVMTVGNDPNAFASDVSSKLSDRMKAIVDDNDAKGEPQPVNFTEAGQPLGNVNYGPPKNPSYTSCSPTVTSLAPPSGPANSQLTINGYDFGDSQVAGSTVTVGGKPATVGSWSKIVVVVTVPADLQPGPAPVVITTSAGTSPTTVDTIFTVTKPQ